MSNNKPPVSIVPNPEGPIRTTADLAYSRLVLEVDVILSRLRDVHTGVNLIRCACDREIFLNDEDEDLNAVPFLAAVTFNHVDDLYGELSEFCDTLKEAVDRGMLLGEHS